MRRPARRVPLQDEAAAQRISLAELRAHQLLGVVAGTFESAQKPLLATECIGVRRKSALSKQGSEDAVARGKPCVQRFGHRAEVFLDPARFRSSDAQCMD